jgi:hypothetical protein
MRGHRENHEAHKLKPVLLAALGEEGLEDGGGVGRKDARRDFRLMVEARVGKDLETGADGATFGVVGTVDETWDTGLDDGAGAHAAGLDGDVERGISEAIVAEKAGGFAKGNHFRMGCGVIVADGAIASTSEDLAFVDEQGADGDFTGFGRRTRFGQGFLHELDVGFHAKRENNMHNKRNRIYAENTEKTEKSCCLTIGEGGNKLGACGNSWSDCSKWIF